MKALSLRQPWAWAVCGTSRGKWGFVLENVRPLPFRACQGKLGFFEVKE